MFPEIHFYMKEKKRERISVWLINIRSQGLYKILSPQMAQRPAQVRDKEVFSWAETSDFICKGALWDISAVNMIPGGGKQNFPRLSHSQWTLSFRGHGGLGVWPARSLALKSCVCTGRHNRISPGGLERHIQHYQEAKTPTHQSENKMSHPSSPLEMISLVY